MSDSNPHAQDAIHRTPFNTTTSLLSHIIPIALFAAQSLHMRYALRPWWSLTKLGHVLLRIFFPESIIWFVGREEWERRWVAREIERQLEEKGQLGDEWDEGSALQRLMSVQGGRVFFKFSDNAGGEKSAVRKEVTSMENELPPMPEAPQREQSRRRPQQPRNPQQEQQQGYPARHAGHYPAQEHLSPYLSPAGVTPQSGPQITPPYPVSEFNLPPDSFPLVPPHRSSFRRPSAHSEEQLPRRPSLHRSLTSETETTAVLLNSNHAQPPLRGQRRIIWSLDPPTHLRRLLATDIPLYINIFNLLPPGSPTYIGLINLHIALPPDLPTVLLISQLIWAITTLALRSPAYSLGGETTISLLEMYTVYALIAFLIERVAIVGCRRPAWGGSGNGGYIIVEMHREDYVHEVPVHPKRGARRGVHQYFWIPLVLMGLAYPVVLVIYAAGIYRAGTMKGSPQIPAVIGVVTGVYVLAVLTFLGVQALERQGREPVGDWSRWVPKAKWVLWGLVGAGRVVVGIWGVWQLVEARSVGGWEGWWGWPHISG
ncbi:hypothetical protein L211DRAFT_853108 [Terfezia boudieri ATCC MYA-4762]|uniref:Uncharacterized protein n=1 Tax=Terfezia boudieri ATCC MYA-4762 TaxID=1051890 RepID=A0A3N4L980_9PEZI|nr:hypothetical protein L211DRAFT_853108 [Terfezia boudieri ATCC MYA-4762]